MTDLQTDAEQLAASYGYNVDALLFQFNRRMAGSFTTTIDGSPEQRERYRLAFQIAVSRTVNNSVDESAALV